MWWDVASAAAFFALTIYFLYRAVRAPRPPKPQILKVRTIHMADGDKIGVSVRALATAPAADPSVTGYTFDATVGGTQVVAPSSIAFGTAPDEFVGDPGSGNLVVAWRYVNSAGAGPAGPQLTFVLQIPKPTLAPDSAPEVASVRVIAAAAPPAPAPA